MSARLSQFIAQENSKPQISVVVPAVNAASRIKKAVLSALNQTYPVLEIIIVDDDSEDETGDLVGSLARRDPRVHYIRHPFKRGIHTAFNSGIRNAQAASPYQDATKAPAPAGAAAKGPGRNPASCRSWIP